MQRRPSDLSSSSNRKSPKAKASDSSPAPAVIGAPSEFPNFGDVAGAAAAKGGRGTVKMDPEPRMLVSAAYWAVAFALVVLVCLVLDIAWIAAFVLSLYGPMVEKVQGSPLVLDPLAGVLAYIFITVQITITIPQNTKTLTPFLLGCAWCGAIGLCSYGIYAWTVKAVVKDWSYAVAVGDTLWGFALYFITAAVVSKIMACTPFRPVEAEPLDPHSYASAAD
uniref:Uncharacterized protein n=1 Tax=Chromera velia CCMP2878 TaxID=1169474 RepID=A0A0G4FCV6_9ALVE|mmetsp:Transcript_36777/g.72348  ORF Transcript_36777/g.72348 Transcript_36777/m.72348 type:complete len:222 (+) Transcript_36777:378-1043(+)|eukprot:Cvel_16232.t1-p1 / transcript=Cvel_16232.t1 / gene=Cvel_16232 / organism=Chromera_velia_CCMP2878 / gene_product=hypothetical protein / transcript_product=hypothetical protein / location=Cvel_scaffold1241:26480-29525(-) / protein_length=221 / sequence_SO=supercontig / SO=protein_coding / is_pseudo=false